MNRQITQELKTTLETEKDILERLLLLEKKKRKAILSMKSLEIRKLCDSALPLQKELSCLHRQKEALLQQILPEKEQNLSQLLELWEEGSQKRKDWSRFADAYRGTALRLQTLIRENETLLQETGASIQRILEDLQESINTRLNPGYAPDGRPKSQNSTPVFLNSKA